VPSQGGSPCRLVRLIFSTLCERAGEANEVNHDGYNDQEGGVRILASGRDGPEVLVARTRKIDAVAMTGDCRGRVTHRDGDDRETRFVGCNDVLDGSQQRRMGRVVLRPVHRNSVWQEPARERIFLQWPKCSRRTR